MMTKTDIAKQAVKFVVGIGASRITSSIIRNNVASPTAIDQIAVAGTSLVVGHAAGEYLGKYTDAKIDAITAWWNDNVVKTDTKK